MVTVNFQSAIVHLGVNRVCGAHWECRTSGQHDIALTRRPTPSCAPHFIIRGASLKVSGAGVYCAKMAGNH